MPVVFWDSYMRSGRMCCICYFGNPNIWSVNYFLFNLAKQRHNFRDSLKIFIIIIIIISLFVYVSMHDPGAHAMVCIGSFLLPVHEFILTQVMATPFSHWLGQISQSYLIGQSSEKTYKVVEIKRFEFLS